MENDNKGKAPAAKDDSSSAFDKKKKKPHGEDAENTDLPNHPADQTYPDWFPGSP